MNSKGKALGLLLLGGLLGAAYPAWKWREAEADAAAAGPAPQIVSYGNVDIRQVALAFRAEGRVSEVRFEEGDRVAAGDLVAALDAEPYREEVALREAEADAAAAELRRLENGFRPQEVEAARAIVAERQATLKTLELERGRREALSADGAVSKQSLDDIEARRDEALARLQSAREELALREEGARQEDIAQAKARLASARARLDIARTRLGDASLFSPSAGTILARALEPGSIARAGETVATLSLSEPVWVRAYVPETDLGRIYPGMEALVFTDSRPDQPYVGQVGFISPEAEFTPKNVETPDLRTRLVYRFRVVVEDPGDGLRQGMPVTVKLRPGERRERPGSPSAEAGR